MKLTVIVFQLCAPGLDSGNVTVNMLPRPSLDDAVSVELSRAISQHLVRCHRCWVIYNTTSRTLEIVSDAVPPAPPLAVSERLHARLQQLYHPSR